MTRSKYELPAATVGFYGLMVSMTGLPVIETLDGQVWTVLLDVKNAAALPLVLPARRQIVETPFADAVRAEARRAIYRALATAADTPELAHRHTRCAAREGIELREPTPRLAHASAWRSADDTYHGLEDARVSRPAGM